MSETPPPAYYECLGSPLPPLYPEVSGEANATGQAQNITVVAEAAAGSTEQSGEAAAEVTDDTITPESQNQDVREATVSCSTASDDSAEASVNPTEVKNKESKNEEEKSK